MDELCWMDAHNHLFKYPKYLFIRQKKQNKRKLIHDLLVQIYLFHLSFKETDPSSNNLKSI